MNDSYFITNKWFWWLISLTSLLLFFRLEAAPIYILDEAKNAQCAREMLLRNDWIVPTFNGELRTDKPALHYWFMIFSYKLFGVNEFAARFFSVLMGIGTLTITYFFTSKWLSKGAAFFAVLVLALSTQFLFEFRLSVPDPYLIFFTTAGLFCGYSYLQQKQWKWIVFTAISLGLATLAKGPVALALPGLCIVSFLIFSKKWSALLDARFLAAAAIYTIVAVPWYYAAHKATNGAWTKGFFFEHNLNRFSSEMEGHGGPFIITPSIVFIGLLPLCAFIFSALKKSTGLWKIPFTKFSYIIIIIYIVFFSISRTKLPNYPMPCYPFVAILLGYWLNEIMITGKRLPLYGFVILLILAFSIPIGGWFALKHEAETTSISGYAWCLAFLPVALIWLIIKQKEWSNKKLILHIYYMYFLFNLIFLTILYPIVYNQNPVLKVQENMKDNSELVAYQDFNPAFLFNLPNNKCKVIIFQHPDSLKNYLNKLTNQEKNRYIVTRADRLSSIDSPFYRIIAQHHDLFENPTTVLLEKK